MSNKKPSRWDSLKSSDDSDSNPFLSVNKKSKNRRKKNELQKNNWKKESKEEMNKSREEMNKSRDEMNKSRKDEKKESKEEKEVKTPSPSVPVFTMAQLLRGEEPPVKKDEQLKAGWVSISMDKKTGKITRKENIPPEMKRQQEERERLHQEALEKERLAYLDEIMEKMEESRQDYLYDEYCRGYLTYEKYVAKVQGFDSDEYNSDEENVEEEMEQDDEFSDGYNSDY